MHHAADGDANGFLAQRRRISADARSALQGDGFLIEKAGQDHLPIKARQQIEIVGPRGKFAEQLTFGG
ncbi:hypothetical protein D3C84_1075010 [compost metagenome]